MGRKNVEPVEFYVAIGMREKVREMARWNGTSVSDYVRQLVEQDMQKHGMKVSLAPLNEDNPHPD